jgi:hypothetical protein
MAYVPQYRYDAFISYAHLDEDGWVSEFERTLRVQLGMALGEPAEIWFDRERLKPGFVLAETIRYDLSRTALFLRLESPSCLQSAYCPTELGWFRNPQLPLDPLEIEHRSRVIPLVIRTQGFGHDPNVIEGAFYDQDGLPLNSEGPEFRRRVARLAQTLAETLQLMETRRKPVYLPHPGVEDAEAADTWTKILNELKAHNYRRVPRVIGADESDAAVLDQLRSAAISIHMVGALSGPETERRINLARQSGKPVVVWISPQARKAASNERQDFLKSLQGIDLLDTGLDAIREVIELRLNPPPPSPVQALKEKGDGECGGLHKIYLICDTRDRRGGAWTLKQRVERAGMEVMLPETGAPDAQELRRDHLKKLKSSDGVLLYYHNAAKRWFEQNWRELNDLEAMRDEPWKLQALCLVRPPDKDVWIDRAKQAGYAEASGAAASRKLIVFGEDEVDPIVRAMRGDS